MKKILSFLIMLSLAVIYVPSAMAQEGMEDLLFMEVPVVYETTKREEKTQESALNIRVITRADIENYGIENIQQLMLFLENTFESMKGRDRVYGVRGVMGYANDKIKFLIDGQELPMELGLGEGQFPITLDEVKRIEIVKGPNTSIFGGNATQATINVMRYNGNDFQGVKTGLAIGNFGLRRGWIHYAEKPSDDLNFDVYFNTTFLTGWEVRHHEFWHTLPTGYGDMVNVMNEQDVTIPIPDHELIAAMNHTNMKLMYRRVVQRRGLYESHIYTHNYTDAMAVETKREGVFGNDNLDFIFSLEASHFGQQYDPYHVADPALTAGPIESKAEKRLEWDAHFYYNPEESWDLLAGLSGNYWNAVGTEWADNFYVPEPGAPGFYLAPDLVTQGEVTPEWFPAFCEINDLADWELWADFKYRINDQTNIVLGGRYVYEFEPGDQLRGEEADVAKFNTDREHLRKFFPKAAVVYSPQENMYLKFVYQEGFNRPNTFEQFSAQNTIPMRGTQKATTAKTYELILDWVINQNMKTLVSVFKTRMEDFMNFAYTGPGWPIVDASAGEVRGFFNVADWDIEGAELNFEVKYENWGAILAGGYMYRNEIDPFDQFNPFLASVGDNLTANSGIIDDSKKNKQNFPEWNATVGGWVKLVDNVTLSAVYKTHRGIKTNQDASHWWVSNADRVITEVDIDTLDIILNAKDVGMENLDLQFLVQNALDEDKIIGSAMDPVHGESITPRYYQGKIVYLW
ncbi:MAG: TonB-dependent receptor [Candidatus Aureabacteria bacterium]|nr:TonB-dependent receptor [Candidatus Auribacterota bacterium]